MQQCPIAPGQSLTYTFNADLYGTSWYHSHYSAQYAGGLFGPMIIHGPKNVPYDIDVGAVMLSDWFHTDYFSLVEQVVELPPQPPPFSDNNLINGKMNFDCSLVKNGQACKNVAKSATCINICTSPLAYADSLIELQVRQMLAFLNLPFKRERHTACGSLMLGRRAFNDSPLTTIP